MNGELRLSPFSRLTLSLVYRALRENTRVSLSDEAYSALRSSRQRLLEALGREPIYGVNTGFGELKNTIIPAGETVRLQLNLIRSHSAGVGSPAPLDVVRLTALFKAAELARGASGVRPEVPEALLEVFNRGIHVYIPLHGSVGASGDLAPLAHLALFLIGEGEYLENGARRRGVPRGFEALSIDVKEGLSLVNGTGFSLALLTLGLLRAYRLLDRLLLGFTLSLAALKANMNAYEEYIHSSKQHWGQRYIASKLRSLLGDSDLVVNSSSGSEQDPYCMRCLPQILGSIVDALRYAGRIAEEEMNSVSDNPLIDEDGRIYSGCNFHAMYIAHASDTVRTVLPAAGELAEKHVERLLTGAHRAKLPLFLAGRPGVDSGLMILQYTVASLLAEAKALSSPASLHNTPTSAGQEDVNSMSTPSLLLLLEQLGRLEWIAAGLLFSATLALRAGLGGRPKGRLGELYDLYSSQVDAEILSGDTPYYMSLEKLREAMFPEGVEKYEYHVIGDLLEKQR